MEEASWEEKMITFVRTAQTMPGKIGEAIAWAKETAVITKRVTGKETEISVSFGGAAGQMAWMVHYDNAGQVEEAASKLLADREYLAAIGKASGLFAAGAIHDQMWRRI
jgi:hypothetical protein